VNKIKCESKFDLVHFKRRLLPDNIVQYVEILSITKEEICPIVIL